MMIEWESGDTARTAFIIQSYKGSPASLPRRIQPAAGGCEGHEEIS